MMNTIHHSEFSSDGIFGDFTFDGDDVPFMVTLEHAFQSAAGWQPVLQPGVYTCVRGRHTLETGERLETFEITGISGHSGVIFHPGNFNRDSKACVLTGKTEVVQADGEEMITGSRVEFAAWMQRLIDVDNFQLEVV